MESAQDILWDIIVVGGGPAGVEAMLQAKKHGLNALLLERDVVGSLINRTMAGKKFLHVYGRNSSKLKGELAFPDRALGSELVVLWQRQVEALNVVINIDVLGIDNKEGVYEVRTDDGCGFRAKNIILASGTFDEPKKLRISGEKNNQKVFYFLDYFKITNYFKNNIIVVGGGNSAVETSLELSHDNRVTLLVRKDKFADTVTEINISEIKDSGVEIYFNSEAKEIFDSEVLVDRQGEKLKIPYDALFIHIGYENPMVWLRSLGIKADGKPVLSENFETNLTGLFIAGALTGADSIIESANQACRIVSYIKSL